MTSGVKVIGLESLIAKNGRTYCAKRGARLTQILEIQPGQVSLPKIMKFLGWMHQDVSHNSF